ncbi:hypothetical protein PTKIN_Ptkin11bG0074000 [Pterospermum kingtungense]
MSLIDGLELPPKFKMPKFERYDGTKCPRTHIISYHRKVELYEKDDKIMIHCFQNSLEGSAAVWLSGLKKGDVSSWNDLANQFVKHFQHMIDMTPTRITLSTMEKRNNETFREYARRWHEVATRVKPALESKEFSFMFIRTLKNPYYNRLLMLSGNDYADVVEKGELLEGEIKEGRVEDASSFKRSYPAKKKEGEAHEITFHQNRSRGPRPQYQQAPQQPNQYPQNTQQLTSQSLPQLTYSPSPQPTQSNNTTVTYTQPSQSQPQNQNQVQNRNPRPPRQFTRLPIPYSEIYSLLYERHLISPVFTNPLQPPYPKCYNPDLHCEYHNGIAGHSIEDCPGLKNKIQNLIDRKIISFNIDEEPSIGKNPLPEHARPSVNMLEFEEDGELIAPVDHLVINCTKNTIKASGFQTVAQPLFINCTRPAKSAPTTVTPKLIIQTPSSFPFESTASVPWNYELKVRAGPEADIGNITGTNSMTRSGRCYGPGASGTEQRKEGSKNQEKGKEPKQEGQKGQVQKQSENLQDKDDQSVDKSKSNFDKERLKPVTEEKEKEFLKYLQHSEYRIVDQLNKLPVRISILQLLLNSEPHRKALDKVLSQAYVEEDTHVEKLETLIENLTAHNHISFSDDEIPPDGRGSVKALYITTICKDYILPKVLIDNGSSLNVMPLSVLQKLSVDMKYLKNSNMNVRAFDGTKRAVTGLIEVPLQIEPCTYQIEFQVMDIKPFYNCLLGWPWIHMAGAVPSTLHQKVKFVMDNKLITVCGEEQMIASVSSSSAPYIDPPEQVLECSFRTLEFVNSMEILWYPFHSRNTHYVTKHMLTHGMKPGMRLGAQNQGEVRALGTPVMRPKSAGLGYNRKFEKGNVFDAGSKRRRVDKDEKADGNGPLFVPGGVYFSDFSPEGERRAIAMQSLIFDMAEMHVNAVEREKVDGDASGIVPCLPGFQLRNWQAVELPVIALNDM